jgi:serine/threonine protein kinase
MPDSTRPQTIGDYDLLAVVGEGGSGTVYRGRHRRTGTIVAVKIMDPELAENPVLLKRFEQEFHTARTLRHPHLVRGLDYGTVSGVPYLVMEFVEGESLGDRLDRDGRMPEAEAVRLIVQVATGLSQAHRRGLVHRDIKPDNILITPDGQAKLTDLGLVKDLATGLHLTRTGLGLGTPHYTAPEQISDAKNADVPSDIYSLAATLYHMVTGELPFHESGTIEALHRKNRNDLKPARAIAPELSPRVESAIRRAMAAVPNKRHRSCREFADDLLGTKTTEPEDPGTASTMVVRAIVPDAPVQEAATVEPVTAPEPESRPSSRFGTWVTWLFVAAVVVVVALVVAFAVH